MIDFTNKSITTQNNVESERLLKKAVAQGFKLHKCEKAIESCRFFRFIGSPYKQVVVPPTVKRTEMEQAITYVELFGDEVKELRTIADMAARWCRAYGYKHLSVYANEEFESYTGKGIAKMEDGTVQRVEVELKKPRKITIQEIEKYFGCPIEIVS